MKKTKIYRGGSAPKPKKKETKKGKKEEPPGAPKKKKGVWAAFKRVFSTKPTKTKATVEGTEKHTTKNTGTVTEKPVAVKTQEAVPPKMDPVGTGPPKTEKKTTPESTVKIEQAKVNDVVKDVTAPKTPVEGAPKPVEGPGKLGDNGPGKTVEGAPKTPVEGAPKPVDGPGKLGDNGPGKTREGDGAPPKTLEGDGAPPKTREGDGAPPKTLEGDGAPPKTREGDGPVKLENGPHTPKQGENGQGKLGESGQPHLRPAETAAPAPKLPVTDTEKDLTQKMNKVKNLENIAREKKADFKAKESNPEITKKELKKAKQESEKATREHSTAYSKAHQEFKKQSEFELKPRDFTSALEKHEKGQAVNLPGGQEKTGPGPEKIPGGPGPGPGPGRIPEGLGPEKTGPGPGKIPEGLGGQEGKIAGPGGPGPEKSGQGGPGKIPEGLGGQEGKIPEGLAPKNTSGPGKPVGPVLKLPGRSPSVTTDRPVKQESVGMSPGGPPRGGPAPSTEAMPDKASRAKKLEDIKKAREIAKKERENSGTKLTAAEKKTEKLTNLGVEAAKLATKVENSGKEPGIGTKIAAGVLATKVAATLSSAERKQILNGEVPKSVADAAEKVGIPVEKLLGGLGGTPSVGEGKSAPASQEKITEATPGKTTGATPEKTTGATPEKITEATPGKTTGATPEKITEALKTEGPEKSKRQIKREQNKAAKAPAPAGTLKLGGPHTNKASSTNGPAKTDAPTGEKTAPAAVVEKTAPAAVVEKTAPAAVVEKTAPAAVVEKTAPAVEKTAPAAVVEKTAPAVEKTAPAAVVEKTAPTGADGKKLTQNEIKAKAISNMKAVHANTKIEINKARETASQKLLGATSNAEKFEITKNLEVQTQKINSNGDKKSANIASKVLEDLKQPVEGQVKTVPAETVKLPVSGTHTAEPIKINGPAIPKTDAGTPKQEASAGEKQKINSAVAAAEPPKSKRQLKREKKKEATAPAPAGTLKLAGTHTAEPIKINGPAIPKTDAAIEKTASTGADGPKPAKTDASAEVKTPKPEASAEVKTLKPVESADGQTKTAQTDTATGADGQKKPAQSDTAAPAGEKIEPAGVNGPKKKPKRTPEEKKVAKEKAITNIKQINSNTKKKANELEKKTSAEIAAAPPEKRQEIIDKYSSDISKLLSNSKEQMVIKALEARYTGTKLARKIEEYKAGTGTVQAVAPEKNATATGTGQVKNAPAVGNGAEKTPKPDAPVTAPTGEKTAPAAVVEKTAATGEGKTPAVVNGAEKTPKPDVAAPEKTAIAIEKTEPAGEGKTPAVGNGAEKTPKPDAPVEKTAIAGADGKKLTPKEIEAKAISNMQAVHANTKTQISEAEKNASQKILGATSNAEKIKITTNLESKKALINNTGDKKSANIAKQVLEDLKQPVEGQVKNAPTETVKLPVSGTHTEEPIKINSPEKLEAATPTAEKPMEPAPAPKPKKTKKLVKELEQTKKDVKKSKDRITIINATLIDPKTSNSTRAKLLNERAGHEATISSASEKVTASSDILKQRNNNKLKVIETSKKVVTMKKQLAKKIAKETGVRVDISSITLKQVLDANPGTKQAAEISKLTNRKAKSNNLSKSISNIKISTAPDAVKPLTKSEIKTTKGELKKTIKSMEAPQHTLAKLTAKLNKLPEGDPKKAKLIESIAEQEKLITNAREKITTLDAKVVASHEATKQISNAKLKAVAVKYAPNTKNSRAKTAKYTGMVKKSEGKLTKMGIKVPEGQPKPNAIPAQPAPPPRPLTTEEKKTEALKTNNGGPKEVKPETTATPATPAATPDKTAAAQTRPLTTEEQKIEALKTNNGGPKEVKPETTATPDKTATAAAATAAATAAEAAATAQTRPLTTEEQKIEASKTNNGGPKGVKPETPSVAATPAVATTDKTATAATAATATATATTPAVKTAKEQQLAQINAEREKKRKAHNNRMRKAGIGLGALGTVGTAYEAAKFGAAGTQAISTGNASSFTGVNVRTNTGAAHKANASLVKDAAGTIKGAAEKVGTFFKNLF